MARVQNATGRAATPGRAKATGSVKATSKAGSAPTAKARAVPVDTGTKVADPEPKRTKTVAAAGKSQTAPAIVAKAVGRAAPHATRSSAGTKTPPPPATKPSSASRAAPASKAPLAAASKSSPAAATKTVGGKAAGAAKPAVKATPPAKTGVAKTPAAHAAKTPAAAKAAPKPPAKAAKVADGVRAAASKAQARREGRSEPLDKFHAEQRQLLLEERLTHVRQAESLKEEADALAAEMEPGESEFGEEGGEGGNLSIERELDLVLSAQAKGAVDEIDRALAKIEAGTYGLCEKCGKEIPKARLKVLPHAPLCVACKSGGLSRR